MDLEVKPFGRGPVSRTYIACAIRLQCSQDTLEAGCHVVDALGSTQTAQQQAAPGGSLFSPLHPLRPSAG